MTALLTVNDLRKAYAGVHALDGVSFAVEAGSITGLIGPNGSGKSTAIDCISGFQKLDGGQVVLAGAAITGAAGGVFCFHLGIIDPTFLDFYYMQTFLIIVIIGGAGSFWGVVVAGIALSALPEVLRFSADFRMIIYGVILVVAMFAMPSGVAGWLRERQIARMRQALQ